MACLRFDFRFPICDFRLRLQFPIPNRDFRFELTWHVPDLDFRIQFAIPRFRESAILRFRDHAISRFVDFAIPILRCRDFDIAISRTIGADQGCAPIPCDPRSTEILVCQNQRAMRQPCPIAETLNQVRSWAASPALVMVLPRFPCN